MLVSQHPASQQVRVQGLRGCAGQAAAVEAGRRPGTAAGTWQWEAPVSLTMQAQPQCAALQPGGRMPCCAVPAGRPCSLQGSVRPACGRCSARHCWPIRHWLPSHTPATALEADCCLQRHEHGQSLHGLLLAQHEPLPRVGDRQSARRPHVPPFGWDWLQQRRHATSLAWPLWGAGSDDDGPCCIHRYHHPHRPRAFLRQRCGFG